MDWRIGDLALLPTDRKLFVKAYFEWSRNADQEDNKTQEDNPWSLAQDAGANYRFVHHMAIGDGVVFAPQKNKKTNDPYLYLGHIEGAYFFNPTPSPDPDLKDFKHQRKVTWRAKKLRAECSEELVYMIGHYLGTLCQIKAVYHPELAAMLKS